MPELGYAARDLQAMAAAAERSHFNVAASLRPNASHYAAFMTNRFRAARANEGKSTVRNEHEEDEFTVAWKN
ncbi:MAG TPA: hypothetical protein VGT81_21440 [Casimicrobiaceae bacterium]|nr:hypothetical protein [Casimicrobiaceae bacterium]